VTYAEGRSKGKEVNVREEGGAWWRMNRSRNKMDKIKIKQ
jgi:hypothetical protein